MPKKPKLETIAEQWADFAAAILPHLSPNSPEYQSVRRVFYSGAFSMFMSIRQMSSSAITEKEGEEYLLRLGDEMEECLKVARQREIERN